MSSQEDNGLLLIDELQDDDELSSDDPVAQREPSSALDSYQEDENSDHESDYMAAEHDEADLNGDTFSKTTSGYNGYIHIQQQYHLLIFSHFQRSCRWRGEVSKLSQISSLQE